MSKIKNQNQKPKQIGAYPFIIYYQKNDGVYRGYYNKDKAINDYDKLPKEIHIYKMRDIKNNNGQSIYKANDDDLMNYVKKFYCDFMILRDDKELNFNYTSCQSDNGAIKQLYYKLQGYGITQHEIINIHESIWINNCSNNALQYCKKGVYENVYSYDFSFNHPKLLASDEFNIPTKQGQEYILNEIPNELQYGYYRMKVNFTNKSIQYKVFRISDDNIYTNYDIELLRELQTKYNVEIEYHLIMDDKPNAYLYGNDCLVAGHKLFGKWYNKMNNLRQKYKDNYLIKHLSSKLWGVFSQNIKICISEDDIDEKGLDIGNENHDYLISKLINRKTHTYYELIDTKKPFRYNIRLKPFITSLARKNTALLAMKNIDNVVRIHTDSVSFIEPLDSEIVISYGNLKFEHKSSGSNIEWINVNEMTRL
jgi:hypothetical protein